MHVQCLTARLEGRPSGPEDIRQDPEDGGAPTPGRFDYHVLHRSPFPENDGIREVWPPSAQAVWVRVSREPGQRYSQGFSLQGTRALPLSTNCPLLSSIPSLRVLIRQGLQP